MPSTGNRRSSLTSKSGQWWKNDKSSDKHGFIVFNLYCPQMRHASLNGFFWPVWKGLLSSHPVFWLLILQKFTILFQETGLQSEEWIWRGRFTSSLISPALTIGTKFFFFFFFTSSEALLKWFSEQFIGVAAGVFDARPCSCDTNPCLLCCHYLTLVGGGPTDHKQVGSPSYLSDVSRLTRAALPGHWVGHGSATMGHESQTGPVARACRGEGNKR